MLSISIKKEGVFMNVQEKKPIYVIGHKNPDTDSICSAISYAHLKNKISNNTYIPMRAGQVSNETKFILITTKII